MLDSSVSPLLLLWSYKVFTYCWQQPHINVFHILLYSMSLYLQNDKRLRYKTNFKQSCMWFDSEWGREKMTDYTLKAPRISFQTWAVWLWKPARATDPPSCLVEVSRRVSLILKCKQICPWYNFQFTFCLHIWLCGGYSQAIYRSPLLHPTHRAPSSRPSASASGCLT